MIEAKNSRYRPLEHGAVTTKSTQDFNGRLEVIYNSMEAILQKWKPDAVAIEKLFFNSNQKTAIQVAEARGVILLAAQKAGVSISEYTPLQVKQAVTGYGQAQKPQVMEMTKRLLCFNPNANAGRYLRCSGNGDLSWASGRFYAAPYHVVREDVILVL